MFFEFTIVHPNAPIKGKCIVEGFIKLFRLSTNLIHTGKETYHLKASTNSL